MRGMVWFQLTPIFFSEMECGLPASVNIFKREKFGHFSSFKTSEVEE